MILTTVQQMTQMEIVMMMNSIQRSSALEIQHGYNQTGHSKLCNEHLDPKGFGGRFNIFSNTTFQLFYIILRSKAIIKQACIMASKHFGLIMTHFLLSQIFHKFMGIKSNIKHDLK